ncbi:TlpA disulfide reductase family protein [Arcicella aquatica]|uniref:TlpA disulfide reductase family protein n=1 Tax=Arcicella aquatica TaxID=217141 RepID=A0ABU5QRQ8_9BACT|nr:TlpA disulfide reductase family protein [Arcicella aquatica]MEA5259751.1 TlpA disulfide reductase family protein [Arcicella aquatica]
MKYHVFFFLALVFFWACIIEINAKSLEDSTKNISKGVVHIQFIDKPVFNSSLKTKTMESGRFEYLLFSDELELERIYFKEIAEKKAMTFYTTSNWVMIRRYFSVFEFQDYLVHKGDSLIMSFDRNKPIMRKYSDYNYKPLDFTVEDSINKKFDRAYLTTGMADDTRRVTFKYFYDNPKLVTQHRARTAHDKALFIETLENQMGKDLIPSMKVLHDNIQQFLDSLNSNRCISKEIHTFYQQKYDNLLFKLKVMSGDIDSTSAANELNERFRKQSFHDEYLNQCIYNFEKKYFASKSKWNVIDAYNFRDPKESFLLIMNSSLLSLEVKEQMLFLGLSNIDYFFRNEIDKYLNLFTAFASNKSLVKKAQGKYQKDIIANARPSNLHLETLNKQQTSIEDLLQNKKGKVLYIDFWASWCGPCIEEMKYSKQLLQTYKDSNLEVTFFSTDDNFQKWAKASERLELNQIPNNFKILNFGESKFIQEHKFKSIPRYMIVGKDGKIINDNAPRPSDPKTRQLLDELLRK